VHYSIGFNLGQRARHAIGLLPGQAWQAVLAADGKPRDLDKAGVPELSGLLRHSMGGDQLAALAGRHAGDRAPGETHPGA